MAENDVVYLKHIQDAIEKIETYTRNVEFDKFSKESLIQDGVIRRFEIIGEATKKLSGKLREKYSVVPWRDIAGMRDNLIHEYMGVDFVEVWNTVKKDIPFLKEKVLEIIEKEF